MLFLLFFILSGTSAHEVRGFLFQLSLGFLTELSRCLSPR